MPSIKGVNFYPKKFLEVQAREELLRLTQYNKVDWVVVSDLALNITGNRVTDQTQSIYLLRLVLGFI